MLKVICDTKVSARVKRKVYRTVVRQAVFYDLVVLALKIKKVGELEVTRFDAAIFFGGVTKIDKILNQDIRGAAQVGQFRDRVR